jgi:hypothetical protein
MIQEFVRSGSQIHFSYEDFARWKIPTTIGQDAPLSPPREAIGALNAHDALQPITDELFEKPLWWILEVLPISYDWPHFGCARQLPPGPLFHTSVKTRMDDPSVEYKPRAWYEHGTEEYVT